MTGEDGGTLTGTTGGDGVATLGYVRTGSDASLTATLDGYFDYPRTYTNLQCGDSTLYINMAGSDLEVRVEEKGADYIWA